MMMITESSVLTPGKMPPPLSVGSTKDTYVKIQSIIIMYAHKV